MHYLVLLACTCNIIRYMYMFNQIHTILNNETTFCTLYCIQMLKRDLSAEALKSLVTVVEPPMETVVGAVRYVPLHTLLVKWLLLWGDPH